MGNRHIKMFRLPSYQGITNKTTLKFHLTVVRLTYIQNSADNTCWHECRERGNLTPMLLGVSGHQLWKSLQRLVRQLKIDILYDPAISFLGIYPKEVISTYVKGNYIAMFITTYSTIVKTWEQSRFTPKDEWIKNCDTLRNTTQPIKRMKFYLLQENVPNWRPSYSVK